MSLCKAVSCMPIWQNYNLVMSEINARKPLVAVPGILSNLQNAAFGLNYAR